jgi:RNA polymerase sigma-70 factor (ECF subfamily)
MMSDNDAIAAIKQGDSDAFQFLYDNNKKRVASIVRLMKKNDSFTEDYVQGIFLQVYRKLHQFKGDSQFSTWLHRIAVNYVLMQSRRKTPIVIPFSDLTPEPSYDNGASKTLEEKVAEYNHYTPTPLQGVAIQRAVAKLPKRHYEVYHLLIDEGLSQMEVAETTGKSLAAVKAEIRRIRTILQQEL